MSDSDGLCCICLDGLTRATSLPCGHRFCLACIGEYWSCCGGTCQCPLCKASFPTRPQLTTEPAPAIRGGEAPLRPGEVPCDECPEGRRAVRSCLACLASYCEAHLEPHYRDAALGRHLLVTTWKNLEEPVCRTHGARLDRFCRSDQTCICATCARTEHRGHRVVAVTKEAERKKVKLKRSQARLQQIIQDQQRKMEDVKQSLELADGVDKTAEVGEERRAARRRAEGLLTDLEEEVTELQRRSAELEKFSHTEDHLRFLQRFPSFSTLPHSKDRSHAIKSLLQDLRDKREIT